MLWSYDSYLQCSGNYRIKYKFISKPHLNISNPNPIVSSDNVHSKTVSDIKWKDCQIFDDNALHTRIFWFYEIFIFWAPKVFCIRDYEIFFIQTIFFKNVKRDKYKDLVNVMMYSKACRHSTYKTDWNRSFHGNWIGVEKVD